MLLLFLITVEQNSLYAVWFEKYKQDNKIKNFINFADTQKYIYIDCENHY